MRVKVHLRSYSTKKDRRRWLLIVREQGRPEQYIQLGPISKDEAEKRRIFTLNELLTGTYKGSPSVRLFFGEFCDRVLSDYVASTLAPRTLQLYRESLAHERKFFNGWHLNQIRRQDLETLLSRLPIANRTKNIHLSVLRVILRKAVEWGYLVESPAENIPRWREECGGGSRAMTPAELGRVLETATSWEGSVIKVMAFSGMRPGELSQLKFEDIRWDDGIVKVVSDHQRKTKNRKSRIIPLSPELEQLLRFLWDNWPNMQHGNGKEATPAFLPRTQEQKEYIFCHRDGKQVKLFRKCVASACRKAGVVGVTPHGLRKTFCSLLARGGVHPKVAQKLMGHSDIRMTMDIYTEIGDDQLRDAVNGLPTVRDLQKPKLRVVNTAVE